MIHLTDNGPKKCSTTPEKCPVKFNGKKSPHFTTESEAFKEFEKVKENETLVKHSRNSFGKIDEKSWIKYGFQGLGFDAYDELTDEESDKILNESIEELKKMSKEEEDALFFYSTSGFKDFQKVLYRQKNPNNEENLKKYEQIVKNLDNALEKAEKKDKIVYRGLRGDNTIIAPDFNEMNDDFLLSDEAILGDFNDFNMDDPFDEDKNLDNYVDRELQLGKTISFDGYISSTYNPSAVREYTTGGILFEIKTPEGMNMKAISEFEDEDEILLPRESKYKIVGVQKDDHQISSAKYVVQLVAVNDDDSIKTAKNLKNSSKTSWENIIKKPVN